jgi:hypothetical protein
MVWAVGVLIHRTADRGSPMNGQEAQKGDAKLIERLYRESKNCLDGSPINMREMALLLGVAANVIEASAASNHQNGT